MNDKGLEKKFLMIALISMLFSSGLVLCFNLLFDPLWYWDGNNVGEFNVRFNERLSKTNQFLKNKDDYDCVIFGSSRVTLLNQNKIEDHNCFNYSFSSAFAGEHLAFSRYVKHWMGSPEVVVVGVEGFNFLDVPELTIPGFVQSLDSPKHWLSTYLTLDALKFSVRVWRGGEFSRQYTQDFVGIETKRFRQPESDRVWGDVEAFLRGESGATKNKRYSLENKVIYKGIRDVFEASKLVGYVPPISSDRIALMYLNGELESYLQTVYSVSEVFDEFYDFSSPSRETLDPENTWDGSHFYPEINDRVASRLSGANVSEGFGVDLKVLSLSQYQKLYASRISSLLIARYPGLYQESEH